MRCQEARGGFGRRRSATDTAAFTRRRGRRRRQVVVVVVVVVYIAVLVHGRPVPRKGVRCAGDPMRGGGCLAEEDDALQRGPQEASAETGEGGRGSLACRSLSKVLVACARTDFPLPYGTVL